MLPLSLSQLGRILLPIPQRKLETYGDSFYIRDLWGGSGSASSYCFTSYNAQDSPMTKNYSTQNVNTATVEKTWYNCITDLNGTT